jgi:hypothetical protein
LAVIFEKCLAATLLDYLSPDAKETKDLNEARKFGLDRQEYM